MSETHPTGSPRASANKWMIGLGVASLATGATVLVLAISAASDKRQGVVQQLSPAQASAGADVPARSVSGAEPQTGQGGEQGAGRAGRSSADPAKVDQILESAGVYLKKDEGSKAEAILRSGVETYADEPRLRVAYGDLLVTQRRFDDAYVQYEAAIASGAKDPGVEFTAGTIASKIGKTERAMEHYAAAQAGDPKNAEYPLYLGQIQNKLGKNDEAKVSFLRAAKLDPNRAIAWGSLADIALRENQLEIALQHVRKARDLEPASVAWRVIEARALNRKGEPRQAMDLLVGLSDAEKNQPAVARLIGECLGLMGEKEKAAEWMKKAEGK